MDWRAGVELPDAVVDGWRERLPCPWPAPAPPAAAARSADACDMPPRGTPVALPACGCVEVFVTVLPGTEVDNVFGMLLVLSELEDL